MSGSWFLPAAIADVKSARQWYDAQRDGLGGEFVDAVDAAVSEILKFPTAYPVVHRDLRRYLVERFPYCLYYRAEETGVVVVACLHAARHPRRHRRRLRG